MGGEISPAETKCARAVGIGLPERSEPEGPQGAARAQSLLETEKKGLDWIDRLYLLDLLDWIDWLDLLGLQAFLFGAFDGTRQGFQSI